MPLSKKTPGKTKAHLERRRLEGSTAATVIAGKNILGAGKAGKAALRKTAIKANVKADADYKSGYSDMPDGPTLQERKAMRAGKAAQLGGVPVRNSGSTYPDIAKGSGMKKSVSKRVAQSVTDRQSKGGAAYRPNPNAVSGQGRVNKGAPKKK